jgi:hypothetical protein
MTAAEFRGLPKMTGVEARFHELLTLFAAAGRLDRCFYQPKTFTLAAGIKYSPDFAARLNGGRTAYIETKADRGSLGLSGSRDSLPRLKQAAFEYPEYLWILAVRKRGGWHYSTPVKGRMKTIKEWWK